MACTKYANMLICYASCLDNDNNYLSPMMFSFIHIIQLAKILILYLFFINMISSDPVK